MKTIATSFRTFLFILCLTAATCYAQNETPAYGAANDIGLRLGGYSGITYRHFWEKNNGMELSLLGWIPSGGSILSAMWEYRIPLPNRFSLYAGAGLFAGNAYAHDVYYYQYGDRVYYGTAGQPFVGLEGVLGAEYSIPTTPLSIGLDLRPRMFDFIYPYSWDAGLNIRYHF